MAIKIIDYKAGNAPSVLHAVRRLGYSAELVRRPCGFDGASHIILPGVGSAGATMKSLKDLKIMPALEDAVRSRKTLFFGICVGMQILFERSEEDDAKCLGWLSGRVVRFDAKRARVPQMGWNQVRFVKQSPCSAQDGYFYFVNSYFARPNDASDIWGVADHNGPFAAAVCRDNIYATQFHVEKSGEAGLDLLRAFLSLRSDSSEGA